MKKFGDFDLIPDDLPSEGHVTITFQPIDLTAYWKRCGLTADFAGKFYSYCYQEQSQNAQNILSTVMNELLENAAKFSKARTGKISIELRHYSNIIKVEVTNETAVNLSDGFEKSIQKLTTGDIEELYFAHLEEKHGSGDGKSSGLGLMMLLKDYPVRLGFALEPMDKDTVKVSVRAYVSLSEAE